MKIGFQGDLGSNSERAAKKFISKLEFLKNSELIPLINSKNVVNNLKANKIDYGVVAISNVIGGEVKETREALRGFSHGVLRSVSIEINHNVAMNAFLSDDDVLFVISHPQALIQCSNFIKNRFKNAVVVEHLDTALAAKELKEDKLPKGSVAICSDQAIVEYGLQSAYRGISNIEKNETSFILFKIDK